MDVLLVLEMYKVIGHMGDGLENMILGLISSLLPKDNAIAEKLKSTSRSNYFFQQTIKCGHKKFKKLRVYEIQACRKGCCHYIGDNIQEEFCTICDKENDKTANEVIYYFPLRDRIRRLLLSDLKRFFTYSEIRRPPADDFIEDIYDGSTWKWFQQQMNVDRYCFNLI
jgi:hypothetical protein